MTSFVLVPGALHCPAHFGKLVGPLEYGDQNEAIVVELPAPAADSEATFKMHLAVVLAAVDSATKPVVLVGHCTAGRLITAVAAAHHASCIRRLVFLAAETWPGAMAFALEPPAAWRGQGLVRVETGGAVVTVAPGKEDRMAEILFSDAAEVDQAAAAKLLRPSPVYFGESFEQLTLEKYWRLPKAYIKCLRDMALPLGHQDAMFERLGEGALRFELDSGHGPFLSCPELLAATMLQIASLPASAFVFRQLCEASWVETPAVENPDDIGLKLLESAEPGSTAPEVVVVEEPEVAGEVRPPKRPYVAPQVGSAEKTVAYRISKSRRDSTLAKVLKFPAGVHLGAPVEYWYDSFVDDPAQYTNSRLNVPERGHEQPLDVDGVSRSLCALGVVASLECSRVAFTWLRVVTKVPGEPWTRAEGLGQVWGIDGREWNGSFAVGETGEFVEHLSTYTKGDAEAFWEDVPKKAKDLLKAMED